MAIPHSWMKSYLKGRKAQRVKPVTPKSTSTPIHAKSVTPGSKPPRGHHFVGSKAIRTSTKSARPAGRKRPGFIRSMAGAIAGEALKGSGFLGQKLARKIGGLHEMDGAGGLGGTPTNNASSGAVAGLGTGAQEPGRKKKTKAPMLSYKLFKRSKSVK